MEKRLRLGTRKSLLALAQSQWVANQLEQANPGLKVELVKIETRGDVILDIPLSQIDGKEFFVAEIDEALTQGRTDLSVHSFKDLSLDRDERIILGATPPRANPRDILIFNDKITQKIKNRETIKIGTSSPRRLENTPAFLKASLPQYTPEPFTEPKIEFVEIRGNVNTRMGRVHQPQSSEKYLDGVVLAAAGLIRLWRDAEGEKTLTALFKNTRKMLLPVDYCPTASAQGVLAIECRKDDLATQEILKTIHCSEAMWAAAKERDVLAKYGGGCHCAFGTTVVNHPLLGILQYTKGKNQENETIDDFSWQKGESLEKIPPVSDAKTFRPIDGSRIKPEATLSPATSLPDLGQVGKDGSGIFIAHHRAFNPQQISVDFSAWNVWTSGAKSWFKLAQKGVWVEGCAEGLGEDHLISLISDNIWQYPAIDNWTIFTHTQAKTSWGSKNVVAGYQVDYQVDQQLKARLAECTHVYWSSFTQFQSLAKYCNDKTIHACGPGKTGKKISELATLELKIFPGSEEWRKWVKITDK